jgi:formylglycine-generating enzyme
MPGGPPAGNWWQGELPWQNLMLDRWERTSPVGTYPGNDYGVHDMCGNVWEWTATAWDAEESRSPCCGGARPSPPNRPRRVIKRGSHLCAPQLLPPLQARGQAERGDRHLDEPHRLSLRGAGGQVAERSRLSLFFASLST